MKRYYIGKETLNAIECEAFELMYYILENEVEYENNNFLEYGVEIQKKTSSRIEKSQVPDITTDQTRIDFIVKTLMQNNVTPVHLHDIITDML